jgi:sortase A
VIRDESPHNHLASIDASRRKPRVLQVLGKFLISVGVGILLFVGWMLWGTGIYTARQQDRLEQEFDRLPTFSAAATNAKDGTGPPADFRPEPGSPVFRIRIPAIDLQQIVVEGVGTEELRKGPGHYPSCRSGFEEPLCTDFTDAWPGQQRRVIVSGHRTTYGAPFWDLDKLETGDRIITETKWGNFVYAVTTQRIVQPDAGDIVVPGSTAELVLTTCNPKFSAAQRFIVFAELRNSTRPQ